MWHSDRFVICSDTHGDMQDDSAVKAFFEFVDWWHPAIRIHAGDAFDFRWLRRGARDDEKADDVTEDVAAGCQFLECFRPTVWLKGNHDDRLDRALLESSGVVKAYCETTANHIHDRLGRTGCRVLPHCKRRGVLDLGDYKVVHGFAGGLNASRAHAIAYQSNIFHGHTHHIESSPVPSLGGVRGVGLGCLCRLDMDYNKAHLTALRQAHGWVYGRVLKSGKLVWWHAQKIGDEWVLPSEMGAMA